MPAPFVVVAMILAATPGLVLVHGEASRWSGRLRAGLQEAWSNPGVRRLLFAQALALIFFTAVVPIEVVFAEMHASARATRVTERCWRRGARAWCSGASATRPPSACGSWSFWRSVRP